MDLPSRKITLPSKEGICSVEKSFLLNRKIILLSKNWDRNWALWKKKITKQAYFKYAIYLLEDEQNYLFTGQNNFFTGHLICSHIFS